MLRLFVVRRYLSKLSQDKASGKLTPVATEAIKDGPGTWFPCSGTITPWDSHLGSEEYPADCECKEIYLNKMNAQLRTLSVTCCELHNKRLPIGPMPYT